MRLLLDSHTLIWAVDQPAQIPAAAMTAMGNTANERLVSTATIWEIAISMGEDDFLSPCLTASGWTRR